MKQAAAIFLAPMLALAACGAETDSPVAEGTAIPVEADGGIGDGAGPPDASGSDAFAKTMPDAMRGDWHNADLGRAPTSADCDASQRGGADYDRFITIREGGYSYFETGGRITDVHDRSDTGIDATFDTTYADTPTSERRNFTLRPDDTLAIDLDGGEGAKTVVEYLRCPEG